MQYITLMCKIKLIFNDNEVEVNRGISLDEFVRNTGLVSERVIIELNDELIVSADWAKTTLNNHDRILAVTFVGGG